MKFLPVKKYPFTLYLFKFIGVFAFLYFSTLAVIGLAAEGGSYSPVIDHYFNYVAWLRSSLLYGCKALLSVAGIDTYVYDAYTLRMTHGRGVHVGFDCLGYGVLSFWTAFIIANDGRSLKKIKWLSGGLFAIWFINVIRISLYLISVNKQWSMPFGFDHHIWFNISAYSCIFVMIYAFDRSVKIVATS